jgi:hypothetical protein
MTDTWSVAFTRSLLADAGYETTINGKLEKFDFNYEKTFNLHIKNKVTRETINIAILDNQILIADVRPLLDNPAMIGGMKVKQ